jgi:hypothetical protein
VTGSEVSASASFARRLFAACGDDAATGVLHRLAYGPGTPQVALLPLRQALQTAACGSPEQLAALAGDPRPAVIAALAKNQDLPSPVLVQVLTRALADGDHEVACRATFTRLTLADACTLAAGADAGDEWVAGLLSALTDRYPPGEVIGGLRAAGAGAGLLDVAAQVCLRRLRGAALADFGQGFGARVELAALIAAASDGITLTVARARRVVQLAGVLNGDERDDIGSRIPRRCDARPRIRASRAAVRVLLDARDDIGDELASLAVTDSAQMQTLAVQCGDHLLAEVGRIVAGDGPARRALLDRFPRIPAGLRESAAGALLDGMNDAGLLGETIAAVVLELTGRCPLPQLWTSAAMLSVLMNTEPERALPAGLFDTLGPGQVRTVFDTVRDYHEHGFAEPAVGEMLPPALQAIVERVPGLDQVWPDMDMLPGFTAAIAAHVRAVLTTRFGTDEVAWEIAVAMFPGYDGTLLDLVDAATLLTTGS